VQTETAAHHLAESATSDEIPRVIHCGRLMTAAASPLDLLGLCGAPPDDDDEDDEDEDDEDEDDDDEEEDEEEEDEDEDEDEDDGVCVSACVAVPCAKPRGSCCRCSQPFPTVSRF
jgi:hypothetical protein